MLAPAESHRAQAPRNTTDVSPGLPVPRRHVWLWPALAICLCSTACTERLLQVFTPPNAPTANRPPATETSRQGSVTLPSASDTAPELPTAAPTPTRTEPSSEAPDSPRQPAPKPKRLLLRGATLLTATELEAFAGDLLIEEGRIAAIARSLEDGDATRVLDLSGRWITPGLIDPHSHVGIAPAPFIRAHRDANELSGPIKPELRAEDAFWPQDPALRAAASGGVTLIHVLPGSGNVIGGQGVSLHVRPSADGSITPLLVDGAPRSMKIACGENPKRIYGARNAAPTTRMGTEALLRQALEDAQAYAPKSGDARRLDQEALSEVLAGRTLIQNHCYRADEMQRRLAMFAEFGIAPRAFHHAVEAYKIRHRLARAQVGAVVWADWWGRKQEMLDAIPANAALLDAAGVRVALHSDSPYDIQRLNQQAARAMAAGRRAGLDIPRERAIRWVTANPAWVLGLDDRYGTLEVGKTADVVVWSGDPFSVYSRADLVFVEGELVFDRAEPERFPQSDFLLGRGRNLGRANDLRRARRTAPEPAQ